MKHHMLITKKPLLAQTTTPTASTRKEALVNFKIDTTGLLIQAIYNKALF